MLHSTAVLAAAQSERPLAADLLTKALTNTPMLPLRVICGEHSQVVRLKLEQTNPTGSVKYRTAVGLVASLDRDEPLMPGTRVVESTSGNLGIALARVLGELDCHLTAVIDPKVSSRTRELLEENGASIVDVSTRDTRGGYLLTRLAKVRELLDADAQLRWTNQYANPANPDIHRSTLAREILQQTHGEVDAVLVAVSTGGTLVGISDAVRAFAPRARIYAVDVRGSIVTSDDARPHLLTGVGATRKSSFLRPGHFDEALRVSDIDAVACCRMLTLDTGLALGGSGGAVIAAFIAGMRAGVPVAACPVAVIADNGDRYFTTLYDDGWLEEKGALERVENTINAARSRGVRFRMAYDGAA